jgi:hypothetical protein
VLPKERVPKFAIGARDRPAHRLFVPMVTVPIRDNTIA